MTSLLSIQYVTPITSQQQPEVVNNAHLSLKTSRSYSHHGNNNLVTEPEMYKLGGGGGEKRNNNVTTTTLGSNSNSNSNRLAYVDALVDANALVIESIWQIKTHNQQQIAAVVPLRTFIQEVLKRSRTTYSTLQTALFYLFRSRPEIKIHLSRMSNEQQQWEDAYVSCGRRMFLASLVVASKFVQDKTYRNSAWAKIAGLPVSEINAAERIFLNMIDYRLYISQPTFEQWHHLLHLHVEAKTLNRPNNLLQDFNNCPFFAPIDLGYQQQQLQQQQLHQQQQQTQHQPYLPEQPPLLYHPHHIHHHPHPYHHNISPVSPHGNNNIGWTLVLSPTTFLPSVAATTSTKRKRCCNNQPPQLSMSLPSSINSSPMQTPTQISPVKMNNHGTVFNWNNDPLPSIITPPCGNKKRKFASPPPPPPTTTTDTRSTTTYHTSHVRQQQKRFHH